MSRAFFASIPLTLVLIAAVLVPVALTAGTFGYHRWPKPDVEHVAERPLVPAGVPAVAVEPKQPEPSAERSLATARTAATPVAATPGARRSAPRRPAPAPATDPVPVPDPAPAEQPAPDLPPAQQPADQAEETTPPTQVAGVGDTPVLRDAPEVAPPVVDLPPEIDAELRLHIGTDGDRER